MKKTISQLKRVEYLLFVDYNLHTKNVRVLKKITLENNTFAKFEGLNNKTRNVIKFFVGHKKVVTHNLT